MAQIPKGRLVKGPYKPICRDCAIYFSIIVFGINWNGKKIPKQIRQGKLLGGFYSMNFLCFLLDGEMFVQQIGRVQSFTVIVMNTPEKKECVYIYIYMHIYIYVYIYSIFM